MTYCYKITEQIELRLIDLPHAGELFGVLASNRDHLRRWAPAWVETAHSVVDVEKMISAWQQQFAASRGFYFGIWYEGQLCGMASYLSVDWTNRWTVLSYWLDEVHQGRGIMTATCRALVAHAFKAWRLNRITIECATDNLRSRAIPERLGFQLEGIVRGIEWLHDHFADHAMYGLLHSDCRFTSATREARLSRPDLVPSGEAG